MVITTKSQQITLFQQSRRWHPADNDLFVGTYRGTITFNDGEENITGSDGRVTVVKAGNSYNFDFGTGIPNITSVRFEENGDGAYTSVENLDGRLHPLNMPAFKVLKENHWQQTTA